MKWLVAFLVPLLVATLALACGEEKEPATATPSPALTVTATAPEATPMPGAEDEHEGWLTYTNDVYGYEFSYPPKATVTEAPQADFSVPIEEWQEGVTSQDVYERYTGKICVIVDYDVGSVLISAPVNRGSRYVICGRTGFGSPARDREETLVVDGKTHTARGMEVQGPEETLSSHNETLFVRLDDGTLISYGSKPVETATFEDYLKIRDDLVRIVQSYRKLTLTAQSEARVTNVAPEWLNVREGPTTERDVIGSLSEGDVVCLTGSSVAGDDGFQWWPVRSPDGVEGWVAQGDPQEPERPWLTPTGRKCEQ